MHSFSNTINIDAKEIDEKICTKMPKAHTSNGSLGNLSSGLEKEGLCTCPEASVGSDNGTKGELCRWGQSNAAHWTRGTGGKLSEAFKSPFDKSSDKVDQHTAKVISEDVGTLDKDQKSKVASAFARAIEGAEVVEVKAVTSTSVIVNACYDLINDSIGVIPYACVGVGGNFVGVVEGHVTPKLACKVKAGLSYSITPEITAFLGGFYHRVLGDDEYEDLPAMLNLHAHIA